jgi:F-type H+-transporting ATPase subunit b
MIRVLALSLTTAALAAPMAHAATDGPWWTDPVKGLALLSLIIFFAIVWRAGAFKTIFGALDQRGSEIEARIEEAKTLRDQAKKVLADAERQQKRAAEEAQKIVAQAQVDAETMLAQAEKDLEERITRRKAQADARISRAEAEAVDEVRSAAVDAATRAVRDMLAGSKTDSFETAAAEIEKALG